MRRYLLGGLVALVLVALGARAGKPTRWNTTDGSDYDGGVLHSALVVYAGDGGGLVARVEPDGGLWVKPGGEMAAVRTLIDVLLQDDREPLESMPWGTWGNKCMFYQRRHRPVIDACDGSFSRMNR